MARFAPGHSKLGGKVKGTKNKATVAREMAEKEAKIRLAAAKLASREEIEHAAERMHTMNPLEVMLTGMHLKLGRGDVDGAMKIAEAAAPYTAPKLTASEVRVQVASRSDEDVAQEIELLRQKIERSRSAPALTIDVVAEPVSTETDLTRTGQQQEQE